MHFERQLFVKGVGFQQSFRPSTGGKNDQVDRYCLRLGSHGICTGYARRTPSSAGQHGHASSPRLRRWYAHGQWCLQDDRHAPPGPQMPGVGCRARLPQMGLSKYKLAA